MNELRSYRGEQVLLITAGNSAKALSASLSETGFNVTVIKLNVWNQSLIQMANKIRQVLDATSFTRTHIICHSFAGLALKELLELEVSKKYFKRIDRIAFIGCPLNGSEALRFINKLPGYMPPSMDGEFLRFLNYRNVLCIVGIKPGWLSPISRLILTGRENDGLVNKSETIIPVPSARIGVSNSNHFQLLKGRKVVEEISFFLKSTSKRKRNDYT